MTLLKNSGVNLKLKKCFFFRNKMEYIGHMISPVSLEAAPQETTAIEKLKPPSNVIDLRFFLGLFNVFKRFLPNYFARISAPLNLKLRKGQLTTFDILNEEELGALPKLQRRLVKAPVLALPKSKGEYVVETNACDRQVGFVLLQ